ncbi:SRPBCC family protein [Microbacterium sp. 22242]|uniref:SRPBCC family protein n=1 Tax=Microbacterium sp. 22242 TaxID=3453896 RepID=UPI003F84A88C
MRSIMTSTTDAVVDIAKPVAEVYRRWADLEELPEILPSVERVERIDDRLTHWDTRVAGLRRSFYAVTVEDVPNERISWESDAGKQHNGSVTFTPLGPARTRLVLRMSWVPESFLERAGARLGVDQEIAERDLSRFKRCVEDAGTAEPPPVPLI